MCFKTCYSQISIVIDSIDLQFVSLRVQKKCKKNIPIEDMNSGPDITMFLSLVNISDTPVVIQNEKLDIGFSYIFMDSIFRFPQHRLVPLFQECTLFPGQKVSLLICSSVFSPTTIEKDKYKYTSEIKQILPTLRAWVSDKDTTFYSDPCKFLTYSVPFEKEGCFHDNLNKHFVEKMNKLLSKQISKN